MRPVYIWQVEEKCKLVDKSAHQVRPEKHVGCLGMEWVVDTATNTFTIEDLEALIVTRVSEKCPPLNKEL